MAMWRETLEYDPESGNVFVETEGDERKLACTAYTDEDGRLFAAAPALVRALLAVEWEDSAPQETWPVRRAECVLLGTCPACLGRQWKDGEPRIHDTDCLVDVALAAAGLPDQPTRDAARAELAKR